MPIALLALAISAFGIGTTEFVIMGLLPQVASGFGVSIPAAGHLITGYALGVVVGAPLLTALATKLPRKAMLISLMGLFTAGNLASAFAPSFDLLLAARIVSALPHGAFFGVGAVVATELAAPERRARAMSLMFAGLTVANVVGVPMSTMLGQALGWRATFVAVAAIGALSMAVLAALVPSVARPKGVSLRSEVRTFRSPQVWLSLFVVMFGFGGTFAAYSYIAPMMTDVAGFGPEMVTVLLALYGLGLTAGNLIGGYLADRGTLMPGIYAALVGVIAVLVAFTLTVHVQALAALTVFALGAAGFVAVPMLQTRIMDKAQGAPTLAAAAIQSAFNIANAVGAYLGGMVIGAGLGYTSVDWVGATLAASGLALALSSGLLDRRAHVRDSLLAAEAVSAYPNPVERVPEPAMAH
ncbi:MAG TPA: MFS transporter [Streptosporangiaceae bacterium]